MKSILFATLILLLAFVPVALRPQDRVEKSSASEWVLTWSDEFNGPDNSPPDPAKWLVEVNGNGSGNNELEYYTARRENLRQQGGNLVIEARHEKFTGPDGVTRDYTSGRLNTSGHFTQKYGRFEARIQIPYGQGMWPAFWLLGDDISTVGWPACGEIDIMENVGFEPTKVHGTLHGPGYSGDHGISSVYTNPTGRVADAFHIFAAEWEPNVIRFYMDGQLYATRTPAVLPAGQRWVYDHPFFIILNLAIGGNWPRNPDNSTIFPQRMLVDYVRVYARKLTTSASTSEKLTTRVYARKADYIRVYARKSTTSTPETLTTSTSTPEKLNTSACTLEIKNASEVEASLDHRPCRGPIDALRCD